MLRHLASVLLVALLAVGAVVAPPATAPASACDLDGSAGEDGYGEAGGDCDTSNPGDGPHDGGSTGGGPRVCTWDDRVIPCVSEAGYYSDRGCYIKRMDPQPPKDENVWGGRDEGMIVMCTPPRDECLDDLDIGSGNGIGSHWCAPQPMWVAEMPPAAGVSPLELAQQIAAGMHMTMGGIGSTPRSDAGSVGLVGVPIWLWVTDPGPGTTDTIEASDSEGGVTVTVTGTLDRIEWTLADEGGVFRSVTCSGSDIAGTEWSAAASDGGRAASPTCGFGGADNSRTGELTLTGTAYWNLFWEGAGQSGDLPVPAQENSVGLTMGEVQVVTQ